jgi:hypothetical protein
VPQQHQKAAKLAFSKPAFAIDPTHAQFKKTAAMDDILAERQRRSSKQRNTGQGSLESSSSPSDLSSLVRSVKQKTAAAALVIPCTKPAAEAVHRSKSKKVHRPRLTKKKASA